MPTNLFIHTGETFDIYSIGDGLYMKHVIDAVAMLSNSGVLITLGALGMVLGLLLMGFKAVASGLQKVELSYLLVSFLVFTMMFGMKCNVLIHDLGGAPGTVMDGVYPVDNVPWGLAFIGSMVSTLGLNMTETMEQAYGTPTISSADGTAGFGRSLEWINMVRSWDIPSLSASATDSTLSGLVENQASYIAFCTNVAAKNGKLNLALANNVADPWVYGTNTTGGLGFANEFLTFPFVQNDGTRTDLPCGSGFGSVRSALNAPDTYTKFIDSVVPRTKPFVNIPALTGEQQMTDAFAVIGVSQAEAAAYVRMSSTLVAERAAMMLGDHATGRDVMAAVMINQGLDQRNTQWAANETMFRSIARPMTAFFESMIYATAPFMALLVGFGAWGIAMIARYCILTIWVSLWLPVMSICNLFEITMAQHGIQAMKAASAGMGVGAMSLTSLAATAHLQTQVTNWMATGAMLAASTPAITLMLIFGGAMTATSLASRLQGGDNIDEKQLSPSAINAPPVLQAGSLQQRTAMDGSTAAGAMSVEPYVTGASVRTAAMQSANTAMSASMKQFSSAASAGVSASFTNSQGESVSGSKAFSSTGTASQQAMAQWGRDHGFKISQGAEAGWSAVVSAAVSGKLGLATKLAGALSGGTTGTGTNQSNFTLKDAKRLEEEVGKSSSESGNFSVMQANAASDTLSQQATAGSEQAQRVQSGNEFKAATSDMQKTQSQFSAIDSNTKSVQSGQKMGMNALSNRIIESGQGEATIAKAMDSAGGVAMQKAQDVVDSSQWKSNSAYGRKVQAAVLAMQGSGLPSSANLLPGKEAERAEGYVAALKAGGFAGIGDIATAQNADGAKNAGVGAGVQQGAATRDAQAGIGAAPAVPSMSGVVGENQAALAGGRTDGQSSSVLQRGGMKDPRGGQNAGYAQQAKDGPYLPMTDGAAKASKIYGAESKDVGGTGHAARAELGQAVREANGNDGTGNTGESMVAKAQQAANWAKGVGPSDIMGARDVASKGDSMSPEAFKHLTQNSGHMRFGDWGITPESMYANTKDPETRAASNAGYDQALARLNASPLDRDKSPAMKSAMAAVSTIIDRKGATPEIAGQLQRANESMTTAERDAVNAYARSGGGDGGHGTTVQTPAEARIGSATGKDGLEDLKP